MRFAQQPATISGLIVDYNHYVSGRVDGAALLAWLAKGYERHATTGDPQINAQSLPQSNSPLHDSGVNVGLPFTGS